MYCVLFVTGESSARGEKEKTSVPAGGSSGMKGSGGNFVVCLTFIYHKLLIYFEK